MLSELRRRRRDPGVVAWSRRVRQEDCFLSVVSIGELERGTLFADQPAVWLDQFLRLHGDRLLTIDLGTARRWSVASRW